MYFVGRNVRRAVKIIQSAIRRWLFRRKIFKFKIYIENILAGREAKKLEKLVLYSYMLFSKFHLKHLKFLRNRKRKLKKIRRKLAILKIKNILIREHVVLKNIKNTIKKYKRRITMTLNTNASKGNKQVADSDNIINENIKDDESSTNQAELEKLARMKLIIEMEDLRRNKIKLGKISYKVPKFQCRRLTPRLKKQLSDSSVSASSDNDSKKNAIKNIIASTPDPVVQRKYNKYKNIKSNFMDPTISYSIGLNGPEWINENQEKPKARFTGRATIYSPTQFSLHKIQPKKIIQKRSKNSWNTSTIVSESYTPSLFNQQGTINRYSEKFKSKPLKLFLGDFASKTICLPKSIALQKRMAESPASITPIAYNFETVLPELASISKMYSGKRIIQKAKNKTLSKNLSPLSIYSNF